MPLASRVSLGGDEDVGAARGIVRLSFSHPYLETVSPVDQTVVIGWTRIASESCRRIQHR